MGVSPATLWDVKPKTPAFDIRAELTKLYKDRHATLRDKLDILQRLQALEPCLQNLSPFVDPFASEEAKAAVDRTSVVEAQRAQAQTRRKASG